VVVLDLDGVLWRGDVPIAGAADAVGALRAAGTPIAFLTNNSSAPVAAVVDKLERAGVAADEREVLTSAQVAAEVLSQSVPAGGRVLPCAGPGVVEAVTAAGFTVVDRAPADAVVVGFHRDFDFDGLDRASAAIRAGARFVATNLDPTFPAPDGVVPGAGAIAAAVATASGRAPEVAGKPEAPTVAAVQHRFGTAGIMVGDRPSTDGLLARRLGWPFALVLSGVGGHDPDEPVPEPPPALVGADLAAVTPALLAHLGRREGPG
jgi:HAD superfamily hydrolase (TIGR01450 family)